MARWPGYWEVKFIALLTSFAVLPREQRIPGTHRYQRTKLGRMTALFYSRTFTHVLRPGFSQIARPNLTPHSSNLNAALHYLEAQLTSYLAEKKAA